MSEKKVALFGDVLVDLIKEKKNFSFFPVCGGSIFNTSITLARLGVNVDFYSYIGADFWGDYLISKMKEYNINTENIKRIESYKTALAFCIIDKNGNASYDFYRNKAKVKLNVANISNSSIFHYGSIFSILEENRPNIIKILSICKKNNIIRIYDPNIRKKHLNSNKIIKNIYNNFKSSDIIKCSLEDLHNIIGINRIEDGFDFLSKFNPILSIITDGENGSYAQIKNGKIINVKAIKINNIIDTIGAGDNFSAGLIFFLIKKSILTKDSILSMPENMLYNLLYFANKCASLCLKNRGALLDPSNIGKLKSIFNSL